MMKWCSKLFKAAFLFAVCYLDRLSLSYSHPDIYNVVPKDGSRAIQPYTCHDPATKEEGVCMFSWNCQRSNGTHITYCLDRFYFGSCCRLPPGVHIATPPSITSNEVTELQKLKHRTSTRRPTTESLSEHWYSDGFEEKRLPSSTRGTSRPRPTKVTPTEFPPGLVTWRPNSESSTVNVPNRKKPTKLFSTKPLFASSTTEDRTTVKPHKFTTKRTHTSLPIESSTESSFKTSTSGARNPTSEKPYMPSSNNSPVKTKPTVPQHYSPTATVSKRRTRPTRPYGNTNPKRRTRPTKPYPSRNSTSSQDIRRKTKPTQSTVYNRPTTERVTTYSTIGTWSNILERTTRPLPFTRRTPPTVPTRISTKTTASSVASTTQRSTNPVSTTQRSSSPVYSTTSRATTETSITRRRTRPTRPRPTTTLTRRPSTTTSTRRPSTTTSTRRPSTTTRPLSTTRTTQRPSIETTIEVITFPPFPGAIRTTTQKPLTTTRVTNVRRTTTSRPRTTTSRPKTTTVTVRLPSSTKVTTIGSTTKSTTETPTTTEKITPGNDYTQENTVAHTSAFGDILAATQSPEEIASSTLNPDIELTTEQDVDTTAQWFTMTSSTKHNSIGRNPLTPNRPVQILYDENGHEILKQEEVQVTAVSNFWHSSSSNAPIDVNSEKSDATVVATISTSFPTRVTSDLEEMPSNGEFSTRIPEISAQSSTTSESYVSVDESWRITNASSHKKKHNSTFSFTTPSSIKSTLELRNPSSRTPVAESLESESIKFSTSTTENRYSTTKTPYTKVDTMAYEWISTNTIVEDEDVLHSVDFHLSPHHSIQTATSRSTTIPQSTYLENNNQVLEDLTDAHPKTPTVATIHEDHLMEDYLYDNYDYDNYDDLYNGDIYSQHGDRTTQKNTDQVLETVNNHKQTSSPLATFSALKQNSTIAPNTVNDSYPELQTKHSQYHSTVSPIPDSISLKNKLRPTMPHEENFISEPTQTSSLKPIQKPFLPNIIYEQNQVGKIPIQSTNRPLSSTAPQSTDYDIKSTTLISSDDKPQLSTFYPLTDSTIEDKGTIVTVDNHRPPTAPLDESEYSKPIFNPLVTNHYESVNTSENLSESQNPTTDKFSTVEARPTFITTSEDKMTYDENNEISDHTDMNYATKFTTLINNHGVKYPFPTILMQHTTKDALSTESPTKMMSTNSEQGTPFTTLTNNHGVKYPFPTIVMEHTTKDAVATTPSSEIKSTFGDSQVGSSSIQDPTIEVISGNTFDYIPPTITTTSSDTSSSTTDESQAQFITTKSGYNPQTSESTQTVFETNYTSDDESNTFNRNFSTTGETTSSTISLDNLTDSATFTNTPFPITTTTEIDLASADYKQVCGKPRPGPVGRVVGGGNSYFGEWPWVVSLRQWKKNAFLHKCGATLLNEFWVITAAHCVENVPLSDILLRLGEYDISHENEPLPFLERRVQIVASHPQFDRRTFEYDLALLRFYQPVTFQRNIIPACIPSGNDTYVGKYATVTGWGRLYEDGPLPDVIQEVSLPIITNKLCENMYRQAGFVEDIPDIFICSGYSKGGKDSCEGDSGGPMVLQEEDGRWVLAGVISWGIGCALPNQPGVYTRITKFSEWINQIIIF